MIEPERQGEVDVMRIDGTLNAEKSQELNEALQKVLQAGVPMVLCDMAALQLIDSDGLEGLLEAQEEVSQHGGAMKLGGLSPLVSEILRVTGVGDRFEIFDTAMAGVGSFSR